MNKPVKPSEQTKASKLAPGDTTKDMFAVPPEMLSTKANDAILDIAMRAGNLFRLHVDKLSSDDGFQVIDPKTVAATFQEFARSAKVDPAAVVQQQFALWSDLTLLWQRTATRFFLNTPSEPVIEPTKQDKRF